MNSEYTRLSEIIVFLGHLADVALGPEGEINVLTVAAQPISLFTHRRLLHTFLPYFLLNVKVVLL